MKQSLSLRNSIYQQSRSGSFNGLTVKDGMLINNRPDGQTGIAQAAQMKKAVYRAEKIATMSAAYSIAESHSETESCGCK